MDDIARADQKAQGAGLVQQDDGMIMATQEISSVVPDKELMGDMVTGINRGQAAADVIVITPIDLAFGQQKDDLTMAAQ
jgi:hypothetical protein